MSGRLEGKVAAITGGISGISRAIFAGQLFLTQGENQEVDGIYHAR